MDQHGLSLRVNVIGAGRVGRTLLTLLARDAAITVGDILSRRHDSALAVADALGTGRAVATLGDMQPADLWLLTVPDDQIGEVAHDLAAAGHSATAIPVACHCSGFLSSAELAPLRALGTSVASCHPVLSFADPVVASDQFAGTHCGIEGDPTAVALVHDLFSRIGGVPFSVRSEEKALYHAAAVFSNNFTVVLQAIAQEAWDSAGITDDVAKKLGRTLLGGAAVNVSRLGPAEALTGPAARNDQTVLQRQSAALAEWHPEAARIYDEMSVLALRLKQCGTTRPKPRKGDDPSGACPIEWTGCEAANGRHEQLDHIN